MDKHNYIVNLTTEYENDGHKITMSSAWFLKFGTRIIKAIILQFYILRINVHTFT